MRRSPKPGQRKFAKNCAGSFHCSDDKCKVCSRQTFNESLLLMFWRSGEANVGRAPVRAEEMPANADRDRMCKPSDQSRQDRVSKNRWCGHELLLPSRD